MLDLTLILPALLSFSLAAIISPLIIWWYRRHGWVESPSQQPLFKQTHLESVPRGGGLVIFLACLFSGLLFLRVDRYLIAITLGSGLLALVGWWDDVVDLHPVFRLFTGLVASLIVVGSGIGIAYISSPFGGVIHLDQPQIHFNFFGDHSIWLLSSAFAVFFIMWNMNIINWSKGVDGQLPGFVAIASVFVGWLSLRFNDHLTQFNTLTLSLIVAGAFAGFLIWNFYPQKMMPGYGAGSLAGYLLSILAILSGAKVATVLMTLAIPTADGVFTILRRLRAGKLPWWGDRGHLHHKLLDVLGWGRRRIAVFYWSTSFILGVISLYLSTVGKIVVLLLVTGFVFGFLIWAKWQSIKNSDSKQNPHLPITN